MERRKFLGGVVAATALAGCTGDGGSTSDEESPGNEEESNDGGSTGEEGLAPPTLVDHDITPGPAGGYEMAVTIENPTEQELTRAVGEVAVYNENERLATGRAAAVDLPPGVSAEEDALLESFRVDAVTRYTITMGGETEDFEETREREHEFTGEDFREKLGS